MNKFAVAFAASLIAVVGCSTYKSASDGQASATAVAWNGTIQLGETATDSSSNVVTVDASQNLIVGGLTNGKLSSCGGYSGTCGGASQGASDYYISKYESGGNWLFTQQLGVTSRSTSPVAVLTDSAANIYVVGSTTGYLVDCSGVSAACTGAAGQGAYDIFITAYTPRGAWLWTKQLGETSKTTIATGASIDSSGNIYIAGYTTGSLTTCAGVSNSCSGSSVGTDDLFIAKYTSAGAYVSLHQLGQSGKVTKARSMGLDSSGNIYVGGLTGGYIPSCSSGTCASTASQGTSDYFIIKYDSSFAWVWAQQLGETGKAVSLNSLAVDSSGSVVVSGNTTGRLSSCAGVSASCSGSTTDANGDVYVSRYDSSGNFQWLQQIDAPYATDYGYLGVDASNNIFVTGKTEANLVSCQGGSTSCAGTSTGTADLFLTKYQSTGAWLFTRQLGSASHSFDSALLAVDSSGSPFVVGDTDGSLITSTCKGLSPFCTGASTGSLDSFAIKYDTNGSIQ